MKVITNSIFTLLSLISMAFAQAEPPVTEGEPQNEGPTTYEDFKEVFKSALPAGEVGKIGFYSEIKVQEGQIYLNGADTSKLMEIYGNLPSSYGGAILALDESYVITFNYDDIGYVKDDEKEDLDADELLKVFKDDDKAANKQRTAAGLDTLTTAGWSVEPNYNTTTNNLEWALLLRSGDGTETVNHNIKLLGRKGVTDATLICDPEHLTSLRPMLDTTLAGFTYTAGNKYSEFKEGDKVSDYGLKALMVGGGIFAAAKLGFFAKFWKFLVGGAVVVGAFVKNKIFGRK